MMAWSFLPGAVVQAVGWALVRFVWEGFLPMP